MPDVYDVFVYFGIRVGVSKRKNVLRALIDMASARISNSISGTPQSANHWIRRHFIAMAAPAPFSWMVRGVNRLTADLPLGRTQQYLERRFRDPQLRAVVTSQWADYGVPPGQSAFATHAVIATHYFEGAWYPRGGASEIASATGAVIRAAGGELLPNHEVTGIRLEGNRAVEVEVHIHKGKDGSRTEFRAPVIVSDAGAWNTFTRPFDHDDMYARRNELLDGRTVMAYLSFPSLKDPQAKWHTAEIIAPLSYSSLEGYREEPWRRRGADYESAKGRVVQALLDLIDRHHPGFREIVEYSELGEHFTAAPSGSIYGYPGTPDRYRKTWLGPDAPIKNLYLTGSDAALPGIMGALMGGVLTASRVLGSVRLFPDYAGRRPAPAYCTGPCPAAMNHTRPVAFPTPPLVSSPTHGLP